MRFTPGASDVTREGRLQGSLIVRSEMSHLVSLIAVLQAAQQPIDYYRLQGRLLDRFYARQRTVEDFRVQFEEAKDAHRALVAQRPLPKDELATSQRLLSRYKEAESANKALLHAYRCVGDGIAWKALRYHRSGITVLGQGPRVGWLSDPAGLDAELSAIQLHWWKDGDFALFNDLTNCLRTGDLTLPFLGDRVGIEEVKAGSSRRRSQDETIASRLRFLRLGEGTGVIGNEHARIAPFPTKLEHHLDRVTLLLAAARSDGYASEVVAPGLLVTTVYPPASQGVPGIDVFHNQALAEAGFDGDGDVITYVSMVRRIRERTQSFPYLAPWTIYPLPAADIAELLMGPMEYFVTVHLPTLSALFASVGIHLELPSGNANEVNSVFMRAVRGDSQVQLSALLREQFLSEVLDPAVMVEAVWRMLDAIDAGAPEGNTLVEFSDEAAAWA